MIAPNEGMGGRPLDSSNRFAVGSRGGSIVIQCLPGVIGRPVLDRASAINLAAWLMLLADPTGCEFQQMVREIKNS